MAETGSSQRLRPPVILRTICGTTRPIKLIGPQTATPVDVMATASSKARAGIRGTDTRAWWRVHRPAPEGRDRGKTLCPAAETTSAAGRQSSQSSSHGPISCRSATAGRCSHPAGASISQSAQAGPAGRKRNTREREFSSAGGIHQHSQQDQASTMPPAKASIAAEQSPAVTVREAVRLQRQGWRRLVYAENIRRCQRVTHNPLYQNACHREGCTDKQRQQQSRQGGTPLTRNDTHARPASRSAGRAAGTAITPICSDSSENPASARAIK